MNLIESLKWRYATKQYDANKKVSDADLDVIRKSIQLSPSSYGLQAFKVIEVNSPALREQLQPASWGQPQLTTASNIFVFCGFKNVSDEHIDAYLKLKAETQGMSVEDLAGYGGFMKTKMSEKSAQEMEAWTARQTYIALGNALTAAGELHIDATPMEGFDAEQYDQILGLSEKNLKAAVVLAIGYRSEEDQTQHGAKVRKPLEQLFEVV